MVRIWDMAGVTLSLVMPTLNVAHKMGETLRTLNAQSYADIELIIVDAGSTDRTLDIVQRGYKGDVRIYTVADYDLPDMYNRGASLAQGEYVGILHPGDGYLSKFVISEIADLIEENDQPDLAYSGCLLREAGRDPRVFLRPFELSYLHQGMGPTSLQSCWFRVSTFRRLGKLDPSYRTRSGFDLLCRFKLEEGLRAVYTNHILVEHDRGARTPAGRIRRKWETGKILRDRFGRSVSSRWWLAQNPWLFLRWWWQSRRQKVWI